MRDLPRGHDFGKISGSPEVESGSNDVTHKKVELYLPLIIEKPLPGIDSTSAYRPTDNGSLFSVLFSKHTRTMLT